MKLPTLLFILCLKPALGVVAQNVKVRIIEVPGKVKQECDALFKSELGDHLYASCLRFDSARGSQSVYENGEARADYLLYYTFSYPAVKEASVTLRLNYREFKDVKQIQSSRFLRKGGTDLPEGVGKKGEKVLPYAYVKEQAVQADPKVKNSRGDFILGEDGFYWDFSVSYPDTDPVGDAERTTTHHVTVDPYTGKVKATFVTHD